MKQLFLHNYCHLLVFCHKIGDIDMFVYKIKLVGVIWIANAYNEQDLNTYLFVEHSHSIILDDFIGDIFREILELELKLFHTFFLQILFPNLLRLDQPGWLVAAVGVAKAKVPCLEIKMKKVISAHKFDLFWSIFISAPLDAPFLSCIN